MPEAMRDLIRRFWKAVDNEGVVVFQTLFGVGFICAGLYGVFVADMEPPLTLRNSMGAIAQDVWYWLNIVGPLTSLVGKAMRGQLTYAGMSMQLAGDVMVAGMLLAYITGTVQTESWGHGAYAAFLGCMLFLCAAVMLIRDVRRLLGIERQIR